MITPVKPITRSGLALGRLKKLLLMAVPAAAVSQLAEYYFAGTLSYDIAIGLVAIPILDAIRKWLQYDPVRAEEEALLADPEA
jgi:hypothetical protein